MSQQILRKKRSQVAGVSHRAGRKFNEASTRCSLGNRSIVLAALRVWEARQSLYYAVDNEMAQKVWQRSGR